MKKIYGPALVMIGTLLFAQVGHAAEQSADYVGGTIEGTGVTGSVAGVNIAGAAFTLNSPTKIKVQDLVGGEVGWLACQDDGDSLCGIGDDITQDGCSTGAFQNLNGFGPGPTTVFIYTSGAIIGCTGNGVAGTITLQN
jgi:hypothetical protein